MGTLAHKLRNAGGAEIAEAALVMPVVFLFLLGIIWFGRAFNIYSTITQAAQQGALVAARPVCATCGSPTNPWNSTSFPGDAAIVQTISGVMQASSLDPALMQPTMPTLPPVFCTLPPPAPAGACSTAAVGPTICREIWLNSPGQPQICGTLVSFQYPFQFYLPFTSLNLNQIFLTARAQSRMEN